jgi:TP901 family phage tail tape measure protein
VNIEDIVIKIKGDVRGLETAIAKAKGLTKEFGSSLSSIGKHMQKAGMMMTAGAAAVGAGFALAVRETMKFEDAMANVRKTTGMSKEELKELEKGLRKLAATIPLSHEELANIAAVAGQLGIQGVENILKFTETAAKMATAFDVPVEEAASAMAKLANIYNIPIAQIDRLGSAINALGNTTAASEAEIIRAMYQIGAAGAQLGATEKQIAAMTATLISMGMAPERAGTRLQSAFNQMTANLDKMAEDMGITVDKLKEKFAEDFYGTLMEYLDTLSKEYPNKLEFLNRANKVFGTVGSKAVLSLAQAYPALTKNVETATKAYKENISLNQEFAARTETLSSKLQTLKNMFMDIGIEVGQTLVPILKELIPVIRKQLPNLKELAVTFTKELIPALKPVGKMILDLVKWFNNLPGPVKENIARFAALATAFAAVAGPLLMVGGGVLQLIGSLGGLSTAVTALAGVGGSGGILAALPLALNPVTLAIAGVAAAGVALYFAWTNNWFGIRDKTKAVINAITKIIGPFANFLRETIGRALEWLGIKFDETRAEFDKVGDLIIEDLEDVSVALEEVTADSSVFRNEINLAVTHLNSFGQSLELVTQNARVYEEEIQRMKMHLGDFSTTINIVSNTVDSYADKTAEAMKKATEATRIHLTEVEKLFWQWGDWEKEYARTILGGYAAVTGKYEPSAIKERTTEASYLRALKKISEQAPELLKQYLYPGSPALGALKRAGIKVDLKADAKVIASGLKEALKETSLTAPSQTNVQNNITINAKTTASAREIAREVDRVLTNKILAAKLGG